MLNSAASKAAQVEQPKNGLDSSLSAVVLFGFDLGFFLQHCMQLFFPGAYPLLAPIAGKNDSSKT